MKNWALFTLLLIFLLGAFLRIYDLGKENVWMDEGIGLATAEKESAYELIDKMYLQEIDPPLYFVVMHYWLKHGHSEFWIRLPSAIFGILSVPLIYLLGRKMFNKSTGIYAALLISISLVGIVYSQEARPYSLCLFLLILSSIFFVNMLRNPKLADYVAYPIFSALALYCHYLAAYIIFIQAAVVFVFFALKKEVITRFLMAQLCILLLYLPWAPYFIKQMVYWTEAWKGALVGMLGLPLWLSGFGALLFAIPLVLGAIALAFTFLIIRSKQIDMHSLLVFKLRHAQAVLLCIAYLAFGLFVSPSLATPFFATRYLYFFSFIILVTVGSLVSGLRKRWQVFFVAALITISMANAYSYYTATTKEEWSLAANYLANSAADKDIILVCDQNTVHSLNYYYTGKAKVLPLASTIYPEKNNEFLSSIRGLIEMSPKKFLVESHCKKTGGFYQNVFNNEYALLDSKQFRGVDISVFQ